MDELNLDQAPQDINKEEFQLERVRLQAFVAAIDQAVKKNSLGAALQEQSEDGKCRRKVYKGELHQNQTRDHRSRGAESEIMQPLGET
ncbi:hypothetical protein TNCV_3896181 [Trichonephila clavipes]|nr:hypothetical protein TNCV_3896181 [Trichonephila clavipes]